MANVVDFNALVVALLNGEALKQDPIPPLLPFANNNACVSKLDVTTLRKIVEIKFPSLNITQTTPTEEASLKANAQNIATIITQVAYSSKLKDDKKFFQKLLSNESIFNKTVFQEFKDDFQTKLATKATSAEQLNIILDSIQNSLNNTNKQKTLMAVLENAKSKDPKVLETIFTILDEYRNADDSTQKKITYLSDDIILKLAAKPNLTENNFKLILDNIKLPISNNAKKQQIIKAILNNKAILNFIPNFDCKQLAKLALYANPKLLANMAQKAASETDPALADAIVANKGLNKKIAISILDNSELVKNLSNASLNKLATYATNDTQLNAILKANQANNTTANAVIAQAKKQGKSNGFAVFFRKLFGLTDTNNLVDSIIPTIFDEETISGQKKFPVTSLSIDSLVTLHFSLVQNQEYNDKLTSVAKELNKQSRAKPIESKPNIRDQLCFDTGENGQIIIDQLKSGKLPAEQQTIDKLMRYNEKKGVLFFPPQTDPQSIQLQAFFFLESLEKMVQMEMAKQPPPSTVRIDASGFDTQTKAAIEILLKDRYTIDKLTLTFDHQESDLLKIFNGRNNPNQMTGQMANIEQKFALNEQSELQQKITKLDQEIEILQHKLTALYSKLPTPGTLESNKAECHAIQNDPSSTSQVKQESLQKYLDFCKCYFPSHILHLETSLAIDAKKSELYELQLQQLKKQTQESQAKIATYETNIAQTQIKMQRLKLDLTVLEKHLNEATAELAKAIVHSPDKAQLAQQLETSINELTTKHKEIQNSLETCQKELTQNQESLKQETEQLKENKQNITKQEQSKAETQKNITDNTQKLQHEKKSLQSIEQQLIKLAAQRTTPTSKLSTP